jgi:hypothetical protein
MRTLYCRGKNYILLEVKQWEIWILQATSKAQWEYFWNNYNIKHYEYEITNIKCQYCFHESLGCISVAVTYQLNFYIFSISYLISMLPQNIRFTQVSQHT